MKTNILDFIDFEKVNTLLEGFNQSTGFVTAILDLEGNVLSKSGWRQICTEFHRKNPETAKKCTISDTELAGKLAAGEKYHFYKCLNGLVDVAVPIIIKGEHIANLFSGQFFFEKPEHALFKKQAIKYGFDKEIYLKALSEVPVVSIEKVKVAMEFLLNMTQLISEVTLQKLEQMELNEAIHKNERILRLFVEHSPASIAMFDNNMQYLVASNRYKNDYKIDKVDLTGLSHYEVFPEISERWKEIHQRCLHGEIIRAKNDQFPRADGTIDWVKWEIRPWYESEDQIGGIILFSEVITSQIEDQEALKESERYNRMLFEQSASGLAVTSFDGRLLDINTAFSKIIGHTVEEAKALTYWDITSEKYQNQEQQQLESLTKTGRYGPVEKEFIHKDGHLVPVTMQGSIIERNNQNYIWSSVEDITERKRAEEKIKENSSLIRIAADNAKLGGWNVDLKDNRSYWSDEVAAIHEMPRGYAPLVEDGINFYAPEWRERITKVFTECAKNGVPYDEEMEIFTSTGKRVWVRTIGEAVRDENGKIFKVQGAFQDISEKKMAESKSREKDLQFRKLSANVPDLIFQFTRRLDGTYFVPVASEGIKNIFGCSPEDVAHDFTPIGNVIYSADVERVIADIEYSAKHLTYFTCEFRVQIPGKPIQWILSRSTPEKLPDGSITWYGFNADITQRKEIEENIKTLNERLQLLVEAIQELSISNSMENIMKTVRTSARKLVNADGSTFILREGDSCFYADEDTVSPLWKGQHFPLKSCISGWAMLNKQPVIIADIYADDRIPIEAYKSTFVRSLAIAPIRLNDPLGAIGAYWGSHYSPSEIEIRLLNTLADATAKAVENVQLIDDLEHKISERTTQLQIVNKELETFTYSVSHDLKAPLRGIDGYSKLLADLYSADLNDEAKLFISTIRSSTQQMNQLIEELLLYSRLERNQFRNEHVKFRPLVDAILKINEDEISAHHISVLVEAPDTDIIADSNGIQMAMRNLIENAIKFSKKVPQPTILIKQEETATSWILSVKDNGVGFDMKYSKRIFEIFQRLHRAEDYSGTGIGLAMVNKAMQRMNGRVWAESSPGQGAAFYLEMPKSIQYDNK